MRKISSLLLLLGVASATLSSCSRSNYAFNPNVPAYLGSERVQAPTTATAAATSEAALPVIAEAPARQAARALAHPMVTAPVAAKPEATVAPAVASVKAPMTKTERKAFKQEVKRQLAAAPKQTKAEGKSQLTALLLALFLGGLGIHRFYLGYTGLGILELLTFGVFGILSLIDLIRIIIGDLKPKDGEYAKKL